MDRFKRFFFALILLSGLTISASCQDIIIDSTALKSRADSMLNAFINEDYKTFIGFTYPKVVAMMGGREKMEEFLKSSILGMQLQGYSFQSVQVGAMQKSVKAGKEIHALLPQVLVIKTAKGTLTSRSWLLAVSTDGANWYFVDAGNLTAEKIKMLFPDYNFELKIPEKQAPVLTND